MEQRCQKCNTAVGADQAFCPSCGAVIGMNMGSTQAGGGWDLASTVVGKQPVSRPTGERGGRPSRPESARPAAPATPAAPAPSKGNSTMFLALIGFVAVLLIGGLVILLLYLNK